MIIVVVCIFLYILRHATDTAVNSEDIKCIYVSYSQRDQETGSRSITVKQNNTLKARFIS
jgi:hypothetical protein